MPIDERTELFRELGDKGQIIGTVTREEAHQNPERIHGGVGILIVDKITKEVYLPKRSANKDTDPSTLDYSTGEHVKDQTEAGKIETWQITAKRGVEEETQLKTGDYTLRRIQGHELDESSTFQTEWKTFYLAVITDKSLLKPDSDEVDALGGGWFKISDLLEIVDKQVSESNSLKKYKIRPMLINDLQQHKPLKKALEEFVRSD